MVKVFLDTDILVDYLRAKKGPIVDLVKLQERGKIELHLSSVSIMELFAGLSALRMQSELGMVLHSLTVISFDKNIARFAGELKRDKKFQTISLADYLIGTTALSMKAQLATRNKKHFQGIPGLKFFDLPKSLNVSNKRKV